MRFLLILMLAAGLVRAAPTSAFSHEAYVWQRRWTPELAQTVADAADVFAAYRVLVGEIDARGAVAVAVDWPALATGVPNIIGGPEDRVIGLAVTVTIQRLSQTSL